VFCEAHGSSFARTMPLFVADMQTVTGQQSPALLRHRTQAVRPLLRRRRRASTSRALAASPRATLSVDRRRVLEERWVRQQVKARAGAVKAAVGYDDSTPFEPPVRRQTRRRTSLHRGAVQSTASCLCVTRRTWRSYARRHQMLCCLYTSTRAAAAFASASAL